MKKLLLFVLAAVALSSCACGPKDGTYIKPRTIVTCDPELDDNNSMVRFLLHATDFQIDGLVYTSSRFHWRNDGSGRTQFIPGSEYDNMGLGPQTSWRFTDTERFIDDIIDAYEKCYDNLLVHDPSYPTPEYLRSVTVYGNCAFEGDYSYDSDGSALIKKNILDDGAEPLFIQAWGGSSSIAAALRSIADEYKGTPEWDGIVEKINRKVILCLSGDQDNAYNSYIAVEWPGIYVQNLGGSMGYYKNAEYSYVGSPEWSLKYMRRGPIGERVRYWGDGKQMVPGDKTDYMGEVGKTADELRAEGYYVWTPPKPQWTLYGDGDSGCYYQLIDNGLRAWQDPTWGGWSGRWDIKKGKPQSGHPAYMGTNISTMNKKGTTPTTSGNTGMAAMMRRMMNREEDHSWPNLSIERNFQEAARIAWSVTPKYEDANHVPVVEGPFDISAKPGQTVKIKAKAYDPDGDTLSLKWWYFPVGTYVLTNDATLSVDNPESAVTTFTVPEDAKPGDTIHFVLQASDNDPEIPLTRYLRTVLTVK